VQTGDGNGAIAEFETAVLLRPDDSGFKGTWEQRITNGKLRTPPFLNSNRRLSLRRRTQTLHYDLGLALKLKRQLPEAMAELRKAAELDPGKRMCITRWG